MMGKLIVLEGTDGSGKSTQTDLLIRRLEQENLPVRRLRFPRYEEESSALVRLYLGGQFGQRPEDVNAYAASTFYAVDRYASFVQDWRADYEAGGIFLSDRYTTSNAVHQGGKLTRTEREAYFRWLYDLEFEKMRLPRPDLVILLDMPVDLTLRLMRRRQTDTHTKADIHEKDETYLRQCHEAARHAAAFYGWKTVPCAERGDPRTVEEIHEDIYRLVRGCVED